MIRINIADDGLRKRLGLIRAGLHNTRPLMRQVADIMLDSTIENFQRGGRPQWIKSQAAEERSGQTLIHKGADGGLLGSIHKSYGLRHAVVGTNKAYAAIHQFGGPIRSRARFHISQFGLGKPQRPETYISGEMPARPYLKLQPAELKEIELTAAAFLGDKK